MAENDLHNAAYTDLTLRFKKDTILLGSVTGTFVHKGATVDIVVSGSVMRINFPFAYVDIDVAMLVNSAVAFYEQNF